MSDLDDITPALEAAPATLEQSIRTLLPCAVGWIAGVQLYGVYVCLHGRYVSSSLYSRLSRTVKAVLWLVFALLTAYTILLWAELCCWVVSTKHDYETILNGYRFESFVPLGAGLVGLPVQSLLMTRVATLIRQKVWRWTFVIVTSVVILFCFINAALGTTAGVLLTTNHYEDIPIDWNKAMAAFLWSSAVIDIAISAALALTLKQRIASFNLRTDNLLKHLILSGIRTASYTAILSLAGAVTSSVFGFWSSYTYVPYSFWVPIPACYGISLYTTLWTRKTVDKYLGQHPPASSGSAPRGAAVHAGPSVPISFGSVAPAKRDAARAEGERERVQQGGVRRSAEEKEDEVDEERLMEGSDSSDAV
ncbi:hypothetical protein JCM6882_007985 [Rhodosporidiobolus microsporus]